MVELLRRAGRDKGVGKWCYSVDEKQFGVNVSGEDCPTSDPEFEAFWGWW